MRATRGWFHSGGILFAFIFVITNGARLELIPERAVVNYMNPAYVRDVTFNVKRYGRNSPYYVNIIGTLLKTWQNNVTFHIVFYERLSNEYRRSFIEMKIRICDLFTTDPYIGKVVRRALPGLVCPMKPGEYTLTNLTLVEVDFPYKWPIEYAKAVATFSHTETKEMLVAGNLTMRFKAVNGPIKKKTK